MTKLYTFIRHNPGVVAGLMLCTVLLCWAYGCESEVGSLKQPHLKINRARLKLEVDSILTEIDLKIIDLDKQDEFKQALFAAGIHLAQGEPLDPIGLALVLGNLLGIGLAADNIRKGSIIKVINGKAKTSVKK